jgi:hypothetical protein
VGSSAEVVRRVFTRQDLGDVVVKLLELVVECVYDSESSMSRVDVEDGSSRLEEIRLGSQHMWMTGEWQTYSSRLVTDEPAKHDGTGSDVICLDPDVILVIESDLHEESGDILGLLVFSSLLVEQPQPCLGSRSTEVPSDGAENMTFHLDKGRLVVCLAAHFRQFPYQGYLVLGFLELGGGP